MRSKVVVLLSAFIFCMTLGIKEAMAAAATDVACKNPCINSFEIQDGQVATSDIADGAVTDAKITGPISSSKIQKPANVIVVAKSGGDFSSIQAAIDSINPTADNPYLIKVMPGTYVENITLKSYIHLQGAGRDVTRIQSPSTSNVVIAVNTLAGVTISGLTVAGGIFGIDNYSSSPKISGNTITGCYTGILNNASSSPTIISGNIITGNSAYGIRNRGGMSSSSIINGNTITGNSDYGIFNESASPTIGGNTITENGRGIGNDIFASPVISGNTITRNNTGIVNYTSSSPTISGNTITGNSAYGIAIYSSSPKIIHNRITDNGGTNYDIFVENDGISVPNISFNIYDSIVGGNTGVGLYKVKSDGSPAPQP
ncbi:MAG: hypothetical protein A3D29_04270 [Deltaproteobacteria bacterium RIFCSPHIGHO2_02_FULL_42_44]|nr:MAG: hypothetical protein A3D29_04270 [Deltaproteobacteria bacterium RIFCSPHIGHO2_02_FULL_42_44]